MRVGCARNCDGWPTRDMRIKSPPWLRACFSGVWGLQLSSDVLVKHPSSYLVDSGFSLANCFLRCLRTCLTTLNGVGLSANL